MCFLFGSVSPLALAFSSKPDRFFPTYHEHFFPFNFIDNWGYSKRPCNNTRDFHVLGGQKQKRVSLPKMDFTSSAYRN